MIDAIDKALVDAIYPNLIGTRDSRLRAGAVKRARRARAALTKAGYDIVPCRVEENTMDSQDDYAHNAYLFLCGAQQ